MSWRENPFVVNVIFEIPIIGSFLKKPTYEEGFHSAGKCAISTVCGLAAMEHMYPGDDMSTHMVHMSEMVVLMTAGKVAYNAVHGAGAMLYQYCASCNSSNQIVTDDAEMQPITASPPRLGSR